MKREELRIYSVMLGFVLAFVAEMILDYRECEIKKPFTTWIGRHWAHPPRDLNQTMYPPLPTGAFRVYGELTSEYYEWAAECRQYYLMNIQAEP